ncbi:MAG TPA: tRNA lysidine(34) synthetase TilS [Pseudolabrys sp.]|jgi:tRNA(Ile)-lysidine synthase
MGFPVTIMPTANKALPAPVSAAETASLFSDLEAVPVLVLAVSGGPDSTALMWLAARWRDTLEAKPEMIAVTVDHGLRKEAKAEAAAVGKLARKLKIAHRTLRWTGKKPKTGLQQAARAARYRLLGEAARKVGASHILTAHTLDDQAETVLIRMCRGSGLAGLGAMGRISVIPGREQGERARNPYAAALRNMDSGPGQPRSALADLGNSKCRSRVNPRSVGGPGMTERGDALRLIRPLLSIPKSRLVATLREAKIPFADDPSNRDPRFTRARLRALMPTLAEEGLEARRLALLAHRLKRADAAVEAATARARDELSLPADQGTVAFDAKGYAVLPAEVGLRLVGTAVAALGNEGPVELRKLEALKEALDMAQRDGNLRFRRSLAGAVVAFTGARIIVERAPFRRSKTLTKRRATPASKAKRR